VKEIPRKLPGLSAALQGVTSFTHLYARIASGASRLGSRAVPAGQGRRPLSSAGLDGAPFTDDL
jgi:hypothetical protein